MDKRVQSGELPEYLYHTTYIHSLGGIQSSGLRPGVGSTWGANTYYGAYSAGKLFLSDGEGVSYWVSKYEDQAGANTDNPEEGWVPVVLRFYLDNYQVDLEVDEHGADDSSAGSWTTKHSVPPNELEIWDGEDWVGLRSVSPDQMLEQALEAAEYESEDDEEFDEYGQPTGWWIMDYDVFLPPDESMEEWEDNPDAPLLLNLDDVHPVVVDQLDSAIARALGAGAKAPLEYVGAGATSVVFKDSQGLAYKAGRWATESNLHTLSEEAEWLAAANSEPELKPLVVDFYGFDPNNAVIIREHVEGYPGAWANETELYKLHKRIDEVMRERQGWDSPEFKGDSYIYRDGQAVLVDASFVHRFGGNLLNYVREVVEGTRPALEPPRDLGFSLRADVFDGNISRADAVPLLEALGQPLPS